MNLILWILFGALVGWIASLIINDLTVRQAETMTVLGVIAGLVGGWIANIICHSSVKDFNIYSVLAAVLVAMISMWLYDKHLISAHK